VCDPYAGKCVNIACQCVRAYDWLAVLIGGRERDREKREIEDTTNEASAELKIEE